MTKPVSISEAAGVSETAGVTATIRLLDRVDLPWAEGLFAAARDAREPAAPRFWRVAPDAVARHLTYLNALLDDTATLALRTDHAVLIAPWTGDHFEVDDVAVDVPQRWASDGGALLSDVMAKGPIRLVAPRVCEAERHALGRGLGLVAQQTWWLKDLTSMGPGQPGTLDEFGAIATLVEAPPVYAPGGPVVLIRPTDRPVSFADVERSAYSGGAVIAVVVQRDGHPSDAVLESAGYHAHCDFLAGAHTRSAGRR